MARSGGLVTRGSAGVTARHRHRPGLRAAGVKCRPVAPRRGRPASAVGADRAVTGGAAVGKAGNATHRGTAHPYRVEVAIAGDTHVPSRAEGIPAWMPDRCRAADHALHAGDLGSPGALATGRGAAGGAANSPRCGATPTHRPLDRRPSPRDERRSRGVTLVLVHGDGPPYGNTDRVVGIVRGYAGADADTGAAGVAGHTDERVGGVGLLCSIPAPRPGPAPGPRRRCWSRGPPAATPG